MDRSVVVRLTANVQDAKRKVREFSDDVRKGARDAVAAAGEHSKAVNDLANNIGLLGVGLTGFAAVAIKKYADFDEAISHVKATGADAAASIDELRAAAIDAGASTVFSATEAANAIENLEKAGVSAKDILTGGLDGALDLAAAGTLAVADAAEIAATTLTQFGLHGDKASHVADILAAGAGKAQGEVTDMALALSYAGIPAHQLGVSLEETAGTIALFAKNGLIGEKAGTSLRSIIASLTSPSLQAAKTMDDLGISVFDASGNFIGLEGVAGVLRSRLIGLTEAERANALGRIFGNESLQAANLLVAEGAAGVREWTAAVDDQGYAAQTARTKLDNLKGDVEQLNGALDTAFITMGSGADGPLRSLVQAATNVVNAFNDMPDGVAQTTLALVGGTGLVLLGIAGLGKLAIAVNDVKTALVALNISARTAGLAVAGVGGALGVATIALLAWSNAQQQAQARTQAYLDTLDEFGHATDETMGAINDALSKDRQSWLGKLFDGDPKSLIDQAKQFGIAVKDLQGYIAGSDAAVKRVNDGLTKYAHGVKGSQADVDDAVEGTRNFQRALDQEASALTDAQKQSAQKALADQEAAGATDNLAASTDGATQSVSAFDQAQEEATKALEEWQAMVGESDTAFLDLAGIYDGVIQKNKDFAQSTADATASSKDSWDDYYDGTSVSAGEFIAQLQAQVEAQGKWEQNILDISGRVRDGLTGDMRTAGEQMIDELLKLGPEGAAQVQLLHDMSEPEFAQVVDLYRQKGTQAVSEFTSKVESYRQPVLSLQVDTNPAYAAVNRFIHDTNGRTIAVNVQGQQVGVQGGVGNMNARANGGLYAFGDGGGFGIDGQYVPRVPQIRPGGATVMWAEPETGWEAYISGKPSQRDRNVSVLADAANRFGYSLTRYDQGGFAGAWSGPGIAFPDGLVIEGTLDMGDGLTGYVRGIARTESVSVVRTALRRG